jgi:hypothetical protein
MVPTDSINGNHIPIRIVILVVTTVQQTFNVGTVVSFTATDDNTHGADNDLRWGRGYK